MNEFSPGIQRVLDHVAATTGWRMGLDGCIRRTVRDIVACPISSMGRRRVACWRQVARSLGYDPKSLADVAIAADWWDPVSPEQKRIRTALLKAARLA